MTSVNNDGSQERAERLFATGVYRPEVKRWYQRSSKAIKAGDRIESQELKEFANLSLATKRFVLARARQSAVRTDTSSLSTDVRGLGRALATLAVGGGLVSWVTSQFTDREGSADRGPSGAEWTLIAGGLILATLVGLFLVIMQFDVWRRQRADIRVGEYERLLAEHVELERNDRDRRDRLTAQEEGGDYQGPRGRRRVRRRSPTPSSPN